MYFSRAGEVILWEGHGGVPVLDTLGQSSAPDASAKVAPAGLAGHITISFLKKVRLETLGARAAIRTTVAATGPLVAAGGTRGGPLLVEIGTHAVIVIPTLATVQVVRARRITDLCSRVKWNHGVHGCLVALVTAWNQLATLLAARLRQPVALLAGARPVPILRHKLELTLLDVALALALLTHLQKVRCALFALQSVRTLLTPFQVRLATLTLLPVQIIPLFTLCAAID